MPCTYLGEQRDLRAPAPAAPRNAAAPPARGRLRRQRHERREPQQLDEREDNRPADDEGDEQPKALLAEHVDRVPDAVVAKPPAHALHPERVQVPRRRDLDAHEDDAGAEDVQVREERREQQHPDEDGRAPRQRVAQARRLRRRSVAHQDGALRRLGH